MERRRPGPRDRAGGWDRNGADPGVDESRRARAHRGEPGGALLVAIAGQALAQGRDVGPRATRERNTTRLRQRRNPANRRTKGWHRLSYGPASLFLPAPGGRRVARGGPRAQGPQDNLRKMRWPT